MASRGTRSGGLDDVSIKAPGSPANGISWRPFSTICSSVENISDEVPACKGRGTVNAN